MSGRHLSIYRKADIRLGSPLHSHSYSKGEECAAESFIFNTVQLIVTENMPYTVLNANIKHNFKPLNKVLGNTLFSPLQILFLFLNPSTLSTLHLVPQFMLCDF